MADERIDPEHDNLATASPDGPPGTPRWVKVSLIIAVAVVLLVVILLVSGGGHGPGRHSAPTSGEVHTPEGSP